MSSWDNLFVLSLPYHHNGEWGMTWHWPYLSYPRSLDMTSPLSSIVAGLACIMVCVWRMIVCGLCDCPSPSPQSQQTNKTKQENGKAKSTREFCGAGFSEPSHSPRKQKEQPKEDSQQNISKQKNKPRRVNGAEVFKEKKNFLEVKHQPLRRSGAET